MVSTSITVDFRAGVWWSVASDAVAASAAGEPAAAEGVSVPARIGYFSASGSKARQTSETVCQRSCGSRWSIRLITSTTSRGSCGARVASGIMEVNRAGLERSERSRDSSSAEPPASAR